MSTPELLFHRKVALLTGYNIRHDTALEMAAKHDLAQIEQAIQYVMSQKAVRNVPGYILAILDGRFALPEQEAKARFRRELERSREENEQREAEAQKRKAERRHRKGVVDAWIVEHPEEYAAILAKKRQKVPEVLTGKSAEDLAERWARNRVYEVATMLAPTMVTSDVKLPSEKRTGACPSRNT